MAIRGLYKAMMVSYGASHTDITPPPRYTPLRSATTDKSHNFIVRLFIALVTLLGFNKPYKPSPEMDSRSRFSSFDSTDSIYESMEYDPNHAKNESLDDSSIESSPISSSTATLDDDLVEERQTKKGTDHPDVSKYQSYIEAASLQFQLSLSGIIDAYQNPLEV